MVKVYKYDAFLNKVKSTIVKIVDDSETHLLELEDTVPDDISEIDLMNEILFNAITFSYNDISEAIVTSFPELIFLKGYRNNKELLGYVSDSGNLLLFLGESVNEGDVITLDLKSPHKFMVISDESFNEDDYLYDYSTWVDISNSNVVYDGD